MLLCSVVTVSARRYGRSALCRAERCPRLAIDLDSLEIDMGTTGVPGSVLCGFRVFCNGQYDAHRRFPRPGRCGQRPLRHDDPGAPSVFPGPMPLRMPLARWRRLRWVFHIGRGCGRSALVPTKRGPGSGSERGGAAPHEGAHPYQRTPAALTPSRAGASNRATRSTPTRSRGAGPCRTRSPSSRGARSRRRPPSARTTATSPAATARPASVRVPSPPLPLDPRRSPPGSPPAAHFPLTAPGWARRVLQRLRHRLRRVRRLHARPHPALQLH